MFLAYVVRYRSPLGSVELYRVVVVTAIALAATAPFFSLPFTCTFIVRVIFPFFFYTLFILGVVNLTNSNDKFF